MWLIDFKAVVLLGVELKKIENMKIHILRIQKWFLEPF